MRQTGDYLAQVSSTASTATIAVHSRAGGDAAFASGSAMPSALFQNLLQQVAKGLAAYPDLSVRVFGRAECLGGAPANDRLSEPRAKDTVQKIVAQGVQAWRLASALTGCGRLPGVGKRRPGSRTHRLIADTQSGCQDGCPSWLPAPCHQRSLVAGIFLVAIPQPQPFSRAMAPAARISRRPPRAGAAGRRASRAGDRHQRSSRGPSSAPSAAVSAMPSVYQVATNIAPVSGQYSW